MGRRAAQEGSIFQRADGKWVAQVTSGYAGGARRRRTVTSATQQEAREALKALHVAVEAGSTPEAEAITVERWLREWLEKEASQTVRPRTLAGYEMIIRKHLAPGLGHHKLRRLNMRHVRDYLAFKARSGLSPRTVQLHHATLRRALTIAMRYELVTRNVAALVQPAPVVRPHFSPMTPEQAQHFIMSINDHPLHSLFLTAISSGLRMSELLGLRWADTDLDTGQLHITASLQRYDREYHLDAPKTALSRRAVPIPPVIADALKRERLRQKELRLKAGEAWQGERWGLVFCMEDGTPRNGTVVTHRFKAALAAAHLPPVRFHDLRHGFAAYLIGAGVDARTIMELLGHSQISTTMDIYGHVLPGQKRAAVDRLNGVLFAPAKEHGEELG